MTQRQPVLFCDFDGTITTKDNIMAIMAAFAPPEWEEIKNDILAQKRSIRSGVGDMFHLIPSSKKRSDSCIRSTSNHSFWICRLCR